VPLKKVVATGAGGPAGINFIMSLRLAPEKMFIIGTEASRHFIYLAPADKTYLVPRADEEGYIERLMKLSEGRRLIFYMHKRMPRWLLFRTTVKKLRRTFTCRQKTL
jgi:hypothetical protein